MAYHLFKMLWGHSFPAAVTANIGRSSVWSNQCNGLNRLQPNSMDSRRNLGTCWLVTRFDMACGGGIYWNGLDIDGFGSIKEQYCAIYHKKYAQLFVCMYVLYSCLVINSMICMICRMKICPTMTSLLNCIIDILPGFWVFHIYVILRNNPSK